MTDVSTDRAKATPAATIAEIALADDPARWEALGFVVSDGVAQLGGVRVKLIGGDGNSRVSVDADSSAGPNADPNAGPNAVPSAGPDTRRGILGWSLNGIAGGELDGIPTTRSNLPPPPTAPEHPNGVLAIDHVVVMSPALDRSVQALQAAGLDLRRIREQPTPAGAPRQAFFRLGEVILEVVQEPEQVLEKRPDGTDGPARFWGLALLTGDLDQTVAHMAEHVSEIRPAVQPGRRIATLRRSAGIAIPVALMSRAPTNSTENSE